MCGRVVQAQGIIPFAIRCGINVPDSRVANVPPRYNGAPSQELWVIRQNHRTGERSLDLLRWGLVPNWFAEKPKPPPINAKAETVWKLPMFREAYARRRCILPVDAFFEWQAIKGPAPKQPYAVGMKDGSPFGLAGVWENWKDPTSGEWIRTFAVVTVPANQLVGMIHDRMPAILAPEDFDRWLGVEPDPRELLRSYPAEPMNMWPVSARVNSFRNDEPSLLEPAAFTGVVEGPAG